jgi:hypothetical protein
VTDILGSILTVAGLSGLVLPDTVPLIPAGVNNSYDGALSANRLFGVKDENSITWNRVDGTLKLEVRPESALLKGVLYRSMIILSNHQPFYFCGRNLWSYKSILL